MMAAPKGSKFWQFRSKHGRDKLFKTPALLWTAACEYFDWCEANPLIEIDFKGKDAYKVEIPKMRAFTLKGLCMYLDTNEAYFRQFKDDEKKSFSTVITRIEDVIYTQKFAGAAAGFLNPNIIARDLGLIDKSEVETSKVITVKYKEA